MEKWIKELSSAISKKVSQLKKSGVVSMNSDNLLQLVTPPAGGPVGPNVAYLYKTEWFPAAVALSPSAKKFVSGSRA